jgi:integrase
VGGLLHHWRTTLAPWTVFNRTAQLRKMLRLLETFGAPPIPLPRMRRPPPREVVATPQQIQDLTAAAPAWLRLFFLLCWQTALRFSEALQPGPANHREGHITVRTKGGAMRTIPTTPEIETLFAAAGSSAGRADWTYIEMLHGKRIKPSAVHTAWNRLTKKLGITNLNPHDLRRTTGDDLYRLTKDIRATQQYLGHASIASTMHYLAPLKEERLRDYQRLLSFHAKPGEQTN